MPASNAKAAVLGRGQALERRVGSRMQKQRNERRERGRLQLEMEGVCDLLSGEAGILH